MTIQGAELALNAAMTFITFAGLGWFADIWPTVFRRISRE